MPRYFESRGPKEAAGDAKPVHPKEVGQAACEAPHLVRPVPFLYPLQHHVWERPYVGAGVLLYDAMSVGR